MVKGRAVRRGGRDKGKEQQWRGVLEEQRRSKQSIRAFCRERDLKEASFYRWRQVIGRRDAEVTQMETSTSVLAPVVVVKDRNHSNSSHFERSVAIEILLRGGATVRVPSNSTSEQLGMVLDALERSRC